MDLPDQLARYRENVSGLTRAIPVALQPETTDEVRRLVEIANTYHTPLYPISTGGNWGLGSALPVRDQTAIVDCHRMNRIHEVNVDSAYAVVEPGVTQGQLYDYLEQHELPLMINVTGSGRDTSLIGNALERGIGYFSSRADHLSGMEVVLGNGEVIRTGFGHGPESKLTHLYRYGIGPDLGALFAQSNYGIVTRAGFDLLPKADTSMSVIVQLLDESKFEPLFDALVALRRRGIMRTIWHVGNRQRSELAMAPLVYDALRARHPAADPATLREAARAGIAREGFGPWNAVGGVFGPPRLLREVQREIRSSLKGLGRVLFLNDTKIKWAKRLSSALSFVPAIRHKRLLLEAVEPSYGLSKGTPTDTTLKSVLWAAGEDTAGPVENPDHHHSGMLYVLPFIPLSGQAALEVVRDTERIFGAAGFAAYITMNFVNDRAAEAVINLAFDLRDAERVTAARRCVDELTKACMDKGYSLYRIGIQQMDQCVNKDDPFWQTVRDLKRVLDPNHIIAPGRYNLV